MQDSNPVQTPLDINIKLQKNVINSNNLENEVLNIPYQQLIGSLVYIAIFSRPDIALAVNFLSQFNLDPNIQHWKAAKRVLRHLKGTADYGLKYEKMKKEYGWIC